MTVKLYRFFGAGKVWGEDALLEERYLEIVDHSQAVAMAYTECFTIRRTDFVQVANAFPKQKLLVQRKMRKIVLQRYLLLSLMQSKPELSRKFPRSFICKSAAEGYIYVDAWNANQTGGLIKTDLDPEQEAEMAVLATPSANSPKGFRASLHAQAQSQQSASPAAGGDGAALANAQRAMENAQRQMERCADKMVEAMARMEAMQADFNKRLAAVEEIVPAG